MLLAILFESSHFGNKYEHLWNIVPHKKGLFTQKQCSRYHNSAITIVILFSMKTMKSLENQLQPQSGATPVVCNENSITSVITE